MALSLIILEYYSFFWLMYVKLSQAYKIRGLIKKINKHTAKSSVFVWWILKTFNIWSFEPIWLYNELKMQLSMQLSWSISICNMSYTFFLVAGQHGPHILLWVWLINFQSGRIDTERKCRRTSYDRVHKRAMDSECAEGEGCIGERRCRQLIIIFECEISCAWIEVSS